MQFLTEALPFWGCVGGVAVSLVGAVQDVMGPLQQRERSVLDKIWLKCFHCTVPRSLANMELGDMLTIRGPVSVCVTLVMCHCVYCISTKSITCAWSRRRESCQDLVQVRIRKAMDAFMERNFLIASQLLQHLALAGVIMSTISGATVGFATCAVAYACFFLTAESAAVTACRVRLFVVVNYCALVLFIVMREEASDSPEALEGFQLCLVWQCVLVFLCVDRSLHLPAQFACLLAEISFQNRGWIPMRPRAYAACMTSTLCLLLEHCLRQHFEVESAQEPVKRTAADEDVSLFHGMDKPSQLIAELDASTQCIKQLHLNFCRRQDGQDGQDSMGSRGLGGHGGHGGHGGYGHLGRLPSLRHLIRPTDWHMVRDHVAAYARALQPLNRPVDLPRLGIRKLANPSTSGSVFAVCTYFCSR